MPARLIEFHPEESQIVLPRLLQAGRQFDLAFLDGNHRFEGILLDLIYCDTQIAGVRRAVNFCVTNLGWRIEEEAVEASRTNGLFFAPVHVTYSIDRSLSSLTSRDLKPSDDEQSVRRHHAET